VGRRLKVGALVPVKEDAMSIDAEDWNAKIAELRPLLTRVAEQIIDPRFRGRIGADSVVDEAVGEASRDRMRLRTQATLAIVAYLKRAVLNTYRDRRRRLTRNKRGFDLEVAVDRLPDAGVMDAWPLGPARPRSPQSLLESAERHQSLRAAIAQLPDDERELMELHALNGLTLREAAGLLHKEYSAVGRLCQRATARLARLMPPGGGL
jgi:RNA polymerase sigma factor (sigma-70 family)